MNRFFQFLTKFLFRWLPPQGKSVSLQKTSQISQRHILTIVTEYYLNSGDFNGITPEQVILAFELNEAVLIELLSELVTSEQIEVNPVGNYHIKMFEHIEVRKQLDHLKEKGLQDCCLYPTKKTLHISIDREEYKGRPFTLKLAEGEPQLKPFFFNLDVLESYRNDPRMHYKHNDIGGGIWITDEASEANQAEERDKVFLQTFGFAYDDNMNRSVAVYCRYLSGLTPEHQSNWESKLLSGNYKLHPDYYRTSIRGEFAERWSLCDAFLMEMKLINKMVEAIGMESLFRQTFELSNRPREFSFLIRPTEKELNAFIHTLDKLISDNINKKFFQNDLELSEEIPLESGKFEVRQKGTLRLLEEWLQENFQFEDENPYENLITTFKKVRRLRQKPAHNIHKDVFDQEYFKQQRKLLIEAYTAMRTLRLIFANHPRTIGIKIDQLLYEGKIWDY